MTEPIDALREAREYYREHGGAKYDYEDPNTGKVCALGALRVCALGALRAWKNETGVSVNPAYGALEKECHERSGGFSIASYNDSLDDPYPVIMDLYDHAIKNMENE